MDILYYSNYCKHSKTVLDFLVKRDLVKQLNCLCVDRRKTNPQTGQMQLVLENGNTVTMPPNVHSVPSLLLVKQNYRCVMGHAQIMAHFKGKVAETQDMAFQGEGEPLGFSLGGGDIQSEKFTSYGASADDLSAKGIGGNRPLYHYVPADGVTHTIETPPETYKSNKLSGDITVDSLEQQRNTDMQQAMQGTNQTPFLPPSMQSSL